MRLAAWCRLPRRWCHLSGKWSLARLSTTRVQTVVTYVGDDLGPKLDPTFTIIFRDPCGIVLLELVQHRVL